MKQGRSLLIIQEILPSYRVPVFDQVAWLSNGSVTVFSDTGTADYGNLDLKKYRFDFVKATWKKYFKIFKYDFSIFRLWKRHDVIFHVADFKFLTLWFVLFFSLFTSKKVFLHGQGGYKSKGIIINLVYTLITSMADGYICYTGFSKKALRLKTPKFLHSKITVCDNTLDIESVKGICQHETSKSFFYIGRIRTGCDIDVLLQAAQVAHVHVEVIGTGEENYLNDLKAKYALNATFHGAIFDEKEQRKIAETCIAGAYGGAAGLSVVHYMALGLPVIVHSDFEKHMGPEPSYVEDGVNGLLFERGSVQKLSEKLRFLTEDYELRSELAKNALTTFKELKTPSMAEKFIKIMGLRE